MIAFDEIELSVVDIDTAVEDIKDTADSNTADIEALRTDTTANTNDIAALQNATEINLENIQEQITSISNSIEAKMDEQQVQLLISQTINSGEVDSITTSTGFTFNEEGLTISKTGSEMETQIDEDGMQITRNGEEVLEVNNTGVVAENISISRYLNIGKNSRIEDYVDEDDNAATAVFWIGG